MFKSRILIVENETIVSLSIKKNLEDLGHEVVGMVCTSEDAVKVALLEMPDLVLMDISLDENKNGIDAACKIRNIMDIPIIYLTTSPREELFQRLFITEHLQKVCMTEHYGYLSKPFSKSEMDVNIQMVLYKHRIKRRKMYLRDIYK